jgi:AcrR family transcriptional regulator
LAKQRIRPQILRAAITLFSNSGYDRLGTKDLAREAGVLEASIYRYFGSKEGLYSAAIQSVVDGSIDDLAKFALSLLIDESVKKKGFASLVNTAINRWYWSFSKEGARLLQQTIMSDAGLRLIANSPLEQMTSILARAMHDFGRTNAVCEAKTSAQTLISVLFQLKISFSTSADEEKQEVDRFVREWIARLPTTSLSPNAEQSADQSRPSNT